DLPPELLRNLKFRARRTHRSLDAELVECLSTGIDTLRRREERFRHAAPRLRQKVRGLMRRRQLDAYINSGRS
ncbi:MAG: hypothetical protein AAGA45_04530, partial [Verrucomicrobiota bacterium]